MKDFDNIEDFLKFCKKNQKFCEENKKTMSDIYASIRLRSAGYTNLDGVDLTQIFKELDKLSTDNGISQYHKQYMSADNEDVMNAIVAKSSDNLKLFLRNNGYHIVELPKTRMLKDAVKEDKQKQDTATVLIGSPRLPKSIETIVKLSRSRAGTVENIPRSVTSPQSPKPRSMADSLRSMEGSRHGIYIDTPRSIQPRNRSTSVGSRSSLGSKSTLGSRSSLGSIASVSTIDA